MKGVFITLEGVEGAGKSSQLQRLSERLQQSGIVPVISKEPGGTSLGKELRFLLLAPHTSGETWCSEAELLLFYADRAQHLATVIRPALEAGRVLLVDRFEDSTRAYQGAQGVPDGDLDALNTMVLKGLKPHLTLVLDMAPEASLTRVATRNAQLGDAFKETRFDSETLAFHRRVRERFQYLGNQDPGRVKLVDANRTPDEVAADIWEHVIPVLHAAGQHV